jgi:hypothetical protein
MPSIGQEGSEYADICTPDRDEAEQTNSIANDLKLYAPKPSLPPSSAKDRIGNVTRTDSGDVAALGLGRPRSEHKSEENGQQKPADSSLKSKASVASFRSGLERENIQGDEEHEQPDGHEVGVRVPMYPNAGLVQAPSPSPYAAPFEKGVGYHNDGSKPRHHGRRTSQRGLENPPGSYGMHGHGIISKDRLEQAYYEKHPELWKKELGAYQAEERKEWHLTSDELNKLVRDTVTRGSGLGKLSDL